ncbi:MAG: YfjI family protein [Phycisphaeraceae bacterium]
MNIEPTWHQGYQCVLVVVGDQGQRSSPLVADLGHDQGQQAAAQAIAQMLGRADVFTVLRVVGDLAQARQHAMAPPSVDQYRPFPIEVLPGCLGEFVRAGAASMCVDPAMIALPLLSALGAAVGNSARLSLGGTWKEPPIVWTVIVAESGTQKSPAIEYATQFVHDRQWAAVAAHRQVLEQHQAEHAGKRNPPRPPKLVQWLINDITTERVATALAEQPRGLLLAKDELAGWLGGFDKYKQGDGDRAHWLEMFGGRSLKVDRQKEDAPMVYVQHAAVCLCGGIQPGVLAKRLSREDFESGLVSRFLLAMPPRHPKQWGQAVMRDDLLQAVRSLFEALYAVPLATNDRGEAFPHTVALSPDACQVWAQFVEWHGREAMDLEGDLSAAWAKMEAYAARFALIIHRCRLAMATAHSVDGSVDRDSLEAGIALAEWFKYETRRVYARLKESKSAGEARRKIEKIQRHGGVVTPRQWCNAHRTTLRSVAEAEADLQQLVNAGAGQWETIQPQGGGRTSRVFRLVVGGAPALVGQGQAVMGQAA